MQTVSRTNGRYPVHRLGIASGTPIPNDGIVGVCDMNEQAPYITAR